MSNNPITSILNTREGCLRFPQQASDLIKQLSLSGLIAGLTSAQFDRGVVLAYPQQAADIIQDAVYTSNLITNGAFDTDSDWTKGVGFTIANGIANRVAAGSASTLSQAITVTPTESYVVIFNILAISGGSVNAKLIGGTDVSGATKSTPGFYKETLIADTGNITFAINTSALGVTCQIDNVIVLPA